MDANRRRLFGGGAADSMYLIPVFYRTYRLPAPSISYTQSIVFYPCRRRQYNFRLTNVSEAVGASVRRWQNLAFYFFLEGRDMARSLFVDECCGVSRAVSVRKIQSNADTVFHIVLLLSLLLLYYRQHVECPTYGRNGVRIIHCYNLVPANDKCRT